MVREKFVVRLTPEERDQLEHMVRAGRSSTRVTTRARILLKTDEGWSAPRLARLQTPLSPNPPMGGVKARQVGMREPTRERAWAPWGPM